MDCCWGKRLGQPFSHFPIAENPDAQSSEPQSAEATPKQATGASTTTGVDIDVTAQHAYDHIDLVGLLSVCRGERIESQDVEGHRLSWTIHPHRKKSVDVAEDECERLAGFVKSLSFDTRLTSRHNGAVRRRQ